MNSWILKHNDSRVACILGYLLIKIFCCLVMELEKCALVFILRGLSYGMA
jgi:hypothetical protein